MYSCSIWYSKGPAISAKTHGKKLARDNCFPSQTVRILKVADFFSQSTELRVHYSTSFNFPLWFLLLLRQFIITREIACSLENNAFCSRPINKLTSIFICPKPFQWILCKLPFQFQHSVSNVRVDFIHIFHGINNLTSSKRSKFKINVRKSRGSSFCGRCSKGTDRAKLHVEPQAFERLSRRLRRERRGGEGREV